MIVYKTGYIMKIIDIKNPSEDFLAYFDTDVENCSQSRFLMLYNEVKGDLYFSQKKKKIQGSKVVAPHCWRYLFRRANGAELNFSLFRACTLN